MTVALATTLPFTTKFRCSTPMSGVLAHVLVWEVLDPAVTGPPKLNPGLPGSPCRGHDDQLRLDARRYCRGRAGPGAAVMRVKSRSRCLPVIEARPLELEVIPAS
jgi:hypothetical protein